MTERSGWSGEERGELQRRRRRRWKEREERGEERTTPTGGASWRVRTRDRRETTSVMSTTAKVLLCFLLFLLPLVGGANVLGASAGGGRRSGPAVGLVEGPDERHLPLALPEFPDEEQEDDGDSNPTWLDLYNPYVVDEMDDHHSRRWTGRSPRSSDPSDPQQKGSGKNRKKKKGHKPPRHSSRDCRVERREMKVRDLGLGYDSDEIVLFKFCVGSCQSARNNYDLALKALLENGSLPRRTARKVSSHPCCRPDRYEPVSFMDAQTSWQTIDSLSAASCMCIG